MERILLATFVIKIKNKKGNLQTINRFNGADDFLDVMDKFFSNIFSNPVVIPSKNRNTPLHLTLEGKHTIDKDKRIIYGFLSSGISGERYKIRNVKTNQHFADIDEDHGTFRDLFFYIKAPKGKDRAALVLQKKAKFGAKTVFKKTINQYVTGLGYQDYRVAVDNLLHSQVFKRMLQLGKLTKVDIIKKKLPKSIEDYYKSDQKLREIPGTLRTSMCSSIGLPEGYREFIDDRFNRTDNARFEIGDDDDIDEIEFDLELNGKTKKFYFQNKSRIQPDIDVTQNIEFKDGAPTVSSLINESEELIKDIIELKPNDDIED